MSFEDSKPKIIKAPETLISVAVLDTSTPKINGRFFTPEKEEENGRDLELVGIFNGNGSEASKGKAFKEIVDRYHQKIFNSVSHLLYNQEDAKEITSEVFVNAHRSLSKFRGESSLSTWLHTIARNLALNLLTYKNRRGRNRVVSLDAPISPDSETTLADAIPDRMPLPRDVAVTEEFLEHVADAMKKLSPDHREILKLYNERGMTYEEIAATLGIGVGTVKSRVARARKVLRKLVSKYN